MPTTPGACYSDLPAVDSETQRVAALCPGALVLHGPDARHETVIRGLTDHSLVHFACHAVSDDTDPLTSHLVLYDHEKSPLTVSDLIHSKANPAELAFLSAFSTAQTSSSLIDEALHITSAFQVTGYPQVVGTLWPVFDRAAAELVGNFYSSYLDNDGRISAESAAYALREALLLARDRYPGQPLYWAAHVHVGR